MEKTAQIAQTAIEISKIAHISKVCEDFSPFPDEAILFGVAMDEKPVIYNISDPHSPNTVVWDRVVGQGLKLIKVGIEFILRYKSQKNYHTEFVIISNNAPEWEKLGEYGMGVWNKNECIAVVPFLDIVAEKVLFALAGWCEGRRGSKKPVILFVDGLENLKDMSEKAQHNFQHVMMLGRKRNVYIIGTAKSESRGKLSEWLAGFQMEIYGQEEPQWFEMMEGKETILFWTPNTTL